MGDKIYISSNFCYDLTNWIRVFFQLFTVNLGILRSEIIEATIRYIHNTYYILLSVQIKGSLVGTVNVCFD